MPTLPNPRHERFAQELAGGKSATEAHALAGYKPSRASASKLKHQCNISQRVAELHVEHDRTATIATEMAAERLSIDREWVMRALCEDRLKAQAAEQMGASIRALELLGKEIGMFVERTENTNVQHVISSEPLTPDEWARKYVTEH